MSLAASRKMREKVWRQPRSISSHSAGLVISVRPVLQRVVNAPSNRLLIPHLSSEAVVPGLVAHAPRERGLHMTMPASRGGASASAAASEKASASGMPGLSAGAGGTETTQRSTRAGLIALRHATRREGEPAARRAE